ncbi:DUF7563 family protein [Salinilacihabitans rarus]|uniref:DUF7563 family protein n=1 Tax=Salinilacihabitans rarus TaxID=2961596 RepID=UPI0020C8E14A|nr:hypothetical protein [Salinilacihabitans rarus]
MSHVDDALHRLADVVEALEETAVDVDRAHVLDWDDQTVTGQLVVIAPADGDLAIGAVAPATGADESVADDQNADTDQEADEYACDVPGCDYTGSERGLAIHKGRAHKGGGDADDEPEDEDDDTGEDPFVEARKRQQDSEESDPSTEDDTTSEATSEAPDVDLAEADADDGAEGSGAAGDDDQDESAAADGAQETGAESENETETEAEDGADAGSSRRYQCACGVACETSFEYYVHRTEDHGVPQAHLGYLEPGEFEEIVREGETLQDIVDATGWSPERTLRALGVYGLSDVVGPDGIELSNLTDYEFEGVAAVDEAGDEETEAVDEVAEEPERSVANDGGAVAFRDYSGSAGNANRCSNCGAHLDKKFTRVFEPDEEGAPRACPNCDNLVREADAQTIREKRSKRGGGV